MTNKVTTLCECLRSKDKSEILDALIIKKSIEEDLLEESKIEEKNPSNIDIRTHIPSKNIETGLGETSQLIEIVKATPICK